MPQYIYIFCTTLLVNSKIGIFLDSERSKKCLDFIILKPKILIKITDEIKKIIFLT